MKIKHHRVSDASKYSVVILCITLIAIIALAGLKDQVVRVLLAAVIGYGLPAVAIVIISCRASRGIARGAKRLAESLALQLRGSVIALSSVVGIQFGIPMILLLIAGLPQVAAYRGAQTLVSAPLQLFQGLQPLLLRVQAENDDRAGPPNFAVVRLWSVLVGTLLTGAIILWLFIPDALGYGVLGDTWGLARPIGPYLLLGAMASQIAFALETHYRVRQLMDRLALVRVAWLPFALLGVAGGSYLLGGVGAAIAIAAASAGLVFVHLGVLGRGSDPE